MRWVIRHRFTEEDVSMARRFDQNKCSIDELNSISKYTVLYSVCECVCVCVCVWRGGGQCDSRLPKQRFSRKLAKIRIFQIIASELFLCHFHVYELNNHM